VLRSNMSLEMRLVCKSCATVLTDEWSLAQVNFVHMPLKISISLEELPTGVALKPLLPKVDGVVMHLHVGVIAKDLSARRVHAWKLLAQMRLAIVQHHLILPRK